MANVSLQDLIDIERLAYYDERLKVWTDEKIKGQVATAVRYKGSVAKYSDLPSNPQEGDMYNVEEYDMNYVWIKDSHGILKWDKYASILDIKVATKEQIDALFA